MASAIGNPIRVDMNWYNIEYEGLRIICWIYGCYGRLGRACPMENASEAVVPEAEIHVSESQAAEASGLIPHLRPGTKLKKKRARREDSDGTCRKQARAGGGPFKFEEAWTPHPSYRELVSNAWEISNHNVLQGLQEVRQDSIAFNKNIFGNIFQRTRRLEARLNDNSKLQDEALLFYNNLFRSAEPLRRDNMEGGPLSILSSRGKDGIQPLFFKQYWYVMGDDDWDPVRSAFVQYGSFDSDLSETLIVLIPKEERRPTSFKQFRLINDVLLFAKASTSHMQLMIKVVSDFCNASDLKGRSNDDRGIHRVNSDTISSPRRFGGLGTRDSRSAINALLEKYLKSQDLFKATAPPSKLYHVTSKLLNRDPIWNWMWRLDAPDEIKVLIWIIFHNFGASLGITNCHSFWGADIITWITNLSTRGVSVTFTAGLWFMEAARHYNYSGDVWHLRQISYLAADLHAARETTDNNCNLTESDAVKLDVDGSSLGNGDGRC
ncbi:hypothetical protein POTOM_020653 [Populus tomentosa]|uniref:Reverse transcriptase zinc-binding domain-containing protein n=1 Tax=Populus tomentosa TaxID=118781 RepID=A0A8X8D093_POPTO|nr:hypothetical protein POTOM_020653 [Populus tomentosa]